MGRERQAGVRPVSLRPKCNGMRPRACSQEGSWSVLCFQGCSGGWGMDCRPPRDGKEDG